ncbi:MAG: hypothetical protein KJP03_06275 [Gammaproteobacteria bacterium]|nr:hypothetical protein [Gammaproteobacteria bacterium]
MGVKADNTSASRGLWFGLAASFGFTALIWITGSLWLNPPPFAETQLGAIMPRMWYPWQLAEPTFWTRSSAWLLYGLHQLSIWYLIWRAQSGDYKYSANLHWFNIAALAVNGVFILLHLVQTHIWYDGLAQDVPEFTSQASVVLMLVAILIMENKRRGMIFGKSLPLSERATRSIRKYHGFYFSWAILYTFWYHPMEFNPGHLLGFLYMFLLMLQGSLFFTRVHTNPRWTIFMEAAVVVHGVMIAIVVEHEWPRFFSGFLALFVITQMHGLGLSKTVRWVIGLGYIAAVAWAYETTKGLSYAYEAALIPLVEFVLVFIVSLLVLGFTKLLSLRTSPSSA